MKRLTYAYLAGTLLITGGVSIMFGWLTRQPIWTLVTPSGTAMVFSTALCFSLAGMALVLPGFRMKSAARMRVVVGYCISLIAGVMLMENAFALDLVLDFASMHRWFEDSNPHPGRMAPNTAFALLMCGLALILGKAEGKLHALRQALVVMAITFGVLGMASYAFLLDLAYSWYSFPRMAFPTGIGIVLVGSGLLFDRPKHERNELRPLFREEASIYAFLGVAVTVLITVVFVSYGTIRSLESRTASVEITYRVRVEFEEMASQYNRIRSAQRDFFASRRTAGSLGFDSHTKVLREKLESISQMISDPDQAARMAVIRGMLEQEFAAVDQGVRERQQRQPASVQPGQPALTTINLNSDRMDSLMHEFKDHESRLLKARKAESEQSAASAQLVIVSGNVVGFAMLLLAFWLMRRQNAQRTRLERHIAEHSAELEDLYNNAPCGYHSVDANGLFVRMNDTELRWLGYEREEVVGKMTHREVSSPQSMQRFEQAFADFKASGMLLDAECDYVRKDGSTLTVALNATAVRDAAGNFVRSRTTLYDVTARKQAEQEIKALNASLQEQAATLEITNRELESFSYSVSHDLRAPLRAIDGFGLMLEEDYAARLDEEGVRYLSVIRKNSQRMGLLIDDLLAFSRLGRQPLVKGGLDMNQLAREVIDESLQNHGENAPTLQIDDLPAAEGDRALLRQVWVNLISNAIKYSSKSVKPLIQVSGDRIGTEIVYSVNDNGVGFNMEYYGKLFGVFQRLHHASQFSGTGVGLAIVQRVVARHGGRTWAEGKENEGATFFFSLPTGENNG